MFLTFGLALGWELLIERRLHSRILHDALLGLAMTPTIAAFFVLSYDIAMPLAISVLPTLLLMNIVGLTAIGLAFRRGIKDVEDFRALTEHARTDALTKLLNKRGMDAKVGQMKYDADVGHALFHFYIDNFKQVNDTHGRGAGDAALAIVTARVRESVREAAVFTRRGGMNSRSISRNWTLRR